MYIFVKNLIGIIFLPLKNKPITLSIGLSRDRSFSASDSSGTNDIEQMISTDEKNVCDVILSQLYFFWH